MSPPTPTAVQSVVVAQATASRASTPTGIDGSTSSRRRSWRPGPRRSRRRSSRRPTDRRRRRGRRRRTGPPCRSRWSPRRWWPRRSRSRRLFPPRPRSRRWSGRRRPGGASPAGTRRSPAIPGARRPGDPRTDERRHGQGTDQQTIGGDGRDPGVLHHVRFHPSSGARTAWSRPPYVRARTCVRCPRGYRPPGPKLASSPVGPGSDPVAPCTLPGQYRPGVVAQWSEQGTHNPSVAGSIPAYPTERAVDRPGATGSAEVGDHPGRRRSEHHGSEHAAERVHPTDDLVTRHDQDRHSGGPAGPSRRSPSVGPAVPRRPGR